MDDDRNESSSGAWSFDDEDYEASFYPPVDCVLIALGILVCLMNGAVITLFVKKEYLRTPKNYFLVSLATSDLLSGSLGIPLAISCSCLETTPLCTTSIILQRFVSVLTILHLLIITMDRYLGVIYAIKYQQLMTSWRANVTITAAWLLSAFSSLIILSWQNLGNDDVSDDAEESLDHKMKIYNSFMLAAFFFLPLMFIAFGLQRIYVAIYRQNQEVRKRSLSLEGRNVKPSTTREMRATVVLTTMLVIFIGCWFTYFLLGLQHTLGNDFFHLPNWAESMFAIFRFSTSLINPMLYTLRNHDFKMARKSVFVNDLKFPWSLQCVSEDTGRGLAQNKACDHV